MTENGPSCGVDGCGRGLMRAFAVAELPVVASLTLTGSGAPVDALGVVELSAAAPDDGTLDAACRAAASTARILIGRSRGAPDPSWEPLLRALTCTLVDGVQEEELPRTCVAVSDVDSAVDGLLEQAAAHPVAATTLSQLLRMSEGLPVADGLVAESLAYSTLLGGGEFRTWLAQRDRRTGAACADPPVLVERAGDTLTVTLNRPTRHNAYSARMRDGLIEALDVAVHDPTVTRVVLRGAGPSFCSGGDLDEFGTTPDPATAHVIRMQRSVPLLLRSLCDRLEAHVHGACIGAGAEFAAFCGTVVADGDAYFQLPEVAMGLVPGAGGSVSISRRIGRWRTAYLALSGRRIDLDTALDWHLVDRRDDA